MDQKTGGGRGRDRRTEKDRHFQIPEHPPGGEMKQTQWKNAENALGRLRRFFVLCLIDEKTWGGRGRDRCTEKDGRIAWIERVFVEARGLQNYW
jgi:hypothetical protein